MCLAYVLFSVMWATTWITSKYHKLLDQHELELRRVNTSAMSCYIAASLLIG